MKDIYSIKPGDKVKFTGVKPFWFTDMIENCNWIIKDKIYTIRAADIFSSYICIKLKETGDLCYNLAWFELI